MRVQLLCCVPAAKVPKGGGKVKRSAYLVHFYWGLSMFRILIASKKQSSLHLEEINEGKINCLHANRNKPTLSASFSILNSTNPLSSCRFVTLSFTTQTLN